MDSFDYDRLRGEVLPMAGRKLIVVGGSSDRTGIADAALRSRKRNAD
jgi:hypothetical protein